MQCLHVDDVDDVDGLGNLSYCHLTRRETMMK